MNLSDYTRAAINDKLHRLEISAEKWVAEHNAQYPNSTPSTHWPFLCGTLCAEMRQMADDVYASLSSPMHYASQIIYKWSTDCSELIECHLDYQKAEKGDDEYPGCSAEVTLTAAYLRGVDIFYLLSEDQISEIEEKALASTTE